MRELNGVRGGDGGDGKGLSRSRRAVSCGRYADSIAYLPTHLIHIMNQTHRRIPHIKRALQQTPRPLHFPSFNHHRSTLIRTQDTSSHHSHLRRSGSIVLDINESGTGLVTQIH